MTPDKDGEAPGMDYCLWHKNAEVGSFSCSTCRDVESNKKVEAPQSELSALRGENERYKAALNSIAKNTCCEKCQEAALVARDALAHGPEGKSGEGNEDTIEDGFGSAWSIVCPMCKRRSMEVVRPGKARCGYCG